MLLPLTGFPPLIIAELLTTHVAEEGYPPFKHSINEPEICPAA